MKTAYIFCKSFDLNTNKINIGEGLYIAADSGLETAEKLGIEPHIIIGDFDSIDAGLLANYADIANIIKYPPQKDDTDSMLCVKYALERGYKNMAVIGGTGGRIDHTLANLALLKYINNHGGTGSITDGFNRVGYLANGSMRVYKNCGYKYVSIVPVSRELRGVTLTGFLYNLQDASVKSDEPYTVSNEIAANCDYGDIIIEQGEAFVCECGSFTLAIMGRLNL